MKTKTFTIKILEQFGVNIEENEFYISLSYQDKFFFDFNKESHIDCSEDLIWSRMISDIFLDGVRLGYLLTKEEIEGDK